MNSETDSRRVKEIFEKAIELTSTHERQGYVDETCNGDALLLARVQTLLHAHFENGGSFLPENASSMVGLLGGARTLEKPGDVVGRYKLLQKIGEGGCGSVWMAEQSEPVRRRVALKVIKLGMDTKSVVARFEAERQALAMMDHPCIAKVYDAGVVGGMGLPTHESADSRSGSAVPHLAGRPFFVMELVRGIPITKYCDENHLTPTARLELFIKVCQGVNHAHQKGIIHRDLKPSNILVTVNDGAPTPKIIDFGIAKATQGRLTDATVFTAFEQFIGTPVYMSPEQAEMSSLDIDTRSDIYSLGVLLYELLTGKPPLDPKALVRAGVDQIRQHIREVEPPTPSRRLHTLAEDERTTIARLRGTAPAQLSLLLRGDLDWIIMRCLEKDRTRRYDTANGLAMDIQRHLRNEPVVARPPSTVYLLQKLMRRHRVAVVATVAIVVALGGGVLVSTWQMVRARRAEGRAETARQSEARLRQEAEAQENIARQRAYAADMNLVSQTLMDGNLDSALELLNRYKPQRGERDLRDWEWRYLWQFCQPDWESVLTESAGEIRSLAISGNDRWLAVAGGRLSVWDLTTRKELTTPLNEKGRTYSRVAFASRRPILAAYTSDPQAESSELLNRIILWDIETGEIMWETTLQTLCVGLFFSEDSETLAAATLSPDDKITLWNVADGSEIRAVSAPQTGIGNPGDIMRLRRMTFAVTPDLALAAHVTSSGGQLRVVDLRTGVQRWIKDGANKGSAVGSLAFSADGRFIASMSYFSDPVIRIWDAATGEVVQRLDPGNGRTVSALQFWPDGNTLVTAGSDRMIRVWDVPSGKLINMLQGHKLYVASLALLSDGKTLVTGASDGVVSLWNTQLRRHEEARIQLPEPVGAWRFSTDGKSLLAATPDGHVVRWQGRGLSQKSVELKVGPIVADWRMGPEQFSPSLRYVALQRSNGRIEVWDTATGRHSQTFDGALDVFPAAHFLDDHTLRVFDQRVPGSIRCREWDLQTGRETRWWKIPIDAPLPTGPEIAPFQSTRSSFLATTFSAERCLISTTEKRSVVFDLRAGASERVNMELAAHRFPRFSPDGSLLAGRRFSDIKLWETGSFGGVAILPTRTKMPESIAFAPNGTRLAVGNGPGAEAVVLWSPQTREPVLTLGGVGAAFVRTQFSPDGSWLGSRGILLPDGDGILNIWRAPTWEEIDVAEKRGGSATLTGAGTTETP